jgi:hypothetical protein
MPVLLLVLPRAGLRRLVFPMPVGQVLNETESSMTPPLYDFLAFPVHERPSFALRTWEGKVVRLLDRLIQGSVSVAPSIDPADPRTAGRG